MADYHNRPKVEAEGKGGRLTGKRIAQAYRAAMQQFKDKMLQDGLTAAEADAFVRQARANGSITSVQGAAAEYAARKQAASQARGQWIEQQEAAEAAFVQEMQAEQKRRDAEAQVRQQAWESYRAGERASYDDPPPTSLWVDSDEQFVVTKGIVLRGGPGSPISYAQQAEETYTGFSTAGQSTPLAESPGLINDVLVWLRDNTPILNLWSKPDAQATIFYKPKTFEPIRALEPLPGFPPLPLFSSPGSILIPGGKGISITAVQVQNSGREVLHMTGVRITAGEQEIRAFPFQSPHFVIVQGFFCKSDLACLVLSGSVRSSEAESTNEETLAR